MFKRDFGPKRRKGKRTGAGNSSEGEAYTDDEGSHEAAQQASNLDFSAATAAQPKETVSQELFKAFSVGDVKQINSTPDHKPPTQEDTIEGRYASVLFTSASQAGALYTVYEDITYIQQLYKNSESFRLFT